MRSGPHTASVEYMGSLTAFFSVEQDHYIEEINFKMKPAAKDLIESQGVPHVEVYALSVNSEYKSLKYNVRDGVQLKVFPKEESTGLSDFQLVRDPSTQPIRFVADVHLGKLARLMRLLGIDTTYSTGLDDHEIIEKAAAENRAALSRDIGLLKHGRLKYGYWPRSDDPNAQILEILSYFDLKAEIAPFSRCLACNGKLREVDSEAVSDRVPEKVKAWNDEYTACPGCEKVYWKGSHYEDLKRKVREILKSI